MKKPTLKTQDPDRLRRRLEAVTLHEIEGNPFTLDDHALFEMFDRNGWSDARRREYLKREAQLRGDLAAADRDIAEGRVGPFCADKIIQKGQ